MRYFGSMIVMCLVVLASCKDKQAPTAVVDGKEYYGEKITADGAISYAQLIQQLETVDSVENVKVTGSIEGVCQAKGCWMNIVSGTNANDEGLFVKFKDYAFFMPLDAAGSTATMSGKAYKEETSVDELRHYAEDEGQSAEEIAKITEPKVELKFMADGVILEKG